MFFKSRRSASVAEAEPRPQRRRAAPEANSEGKELERRVSEIANASIALSKLAPRLAALANEMAAGAAAQARDSTQIAEQANAMSEALEAAIGSLKDSSSSVGGIVQSIRKLADQSKILAINASIEAANAGKMGRAFGAVAGEVESLAGRTSQATSDVGLKVASIEESIQKAVTAAGLGSESEAEGRQSIRGIGAKVESIASVARQSSASADEVATAGREMKALCETLLLSVGTFRIQAHDRAAELFRGIARRRELETLDRPQVEAYLRERMREHSIFEIFYMTDAKGRQITENLWFDGGAGREQALGKDWGRRSWFREAMAAAGEVRVSDIYLSLATDSFCFTLSRAILKGGRPIGVLAADVNFGTLLELG